MIDSNVLLTGLNEEKQNNNEPFILDILKNDIGKKTTKHTHTQKQDKSNNEKKRRK